MFILYSKIFGFYDLQTIKDNLLILNVWIEVSFYYFCYQSTFLSLGQEHAAREALKRLRNTPHIEDDIDEMRAEEIAQQAESQINMLELLRSPSLRMPLTIAIVMQLSQQLSGINAVFYYSTNLFITTGLSETNAKYATIGIGTVMVLMTLVSIPLMDRSGRRTLHLYGLGGMFIFSIFITISFLVKVRSKYINLNISSKIHKVNLKLKEKKIISIIL